MKNNIRIIRQCWSVLIVAVLFSCNKDSAITNGNTSNSESSQGQFQLLTADKSNINFRNNLDEGLNTNILMYEYFYNGGGIACGDFNGDSILDLYFTSNMGENKLYLNLGKNKQGGIALQYRDVTIESQSGGRPGPWKTGVNAVDINADGKLDIYLCYSGAMPALKRKNQLFVNQGNNENGVPIFIDQAEQYGLASEGFSNQSYFFDYDKDGDLDMILLNHNPKNLPILNEAKTRELLSIDNPEKGIRLFNQDNKVFKDVTTTSGINGSELSYGLGVGMSDLNGDGWPDFYVSNDYSVPDYLYMNNKNGTFSNTLPGSIGHNSQFSMGNDVSDINGDGLPDIITLDMLPHDNKRQKLLLAPDNYSKYDLNVRSGFHHQIMRNMLQLNNGDGTFSEIGQLAGISNTDWSWAPLLADYNNDGIKDLYVTNGYNKDYTNMDFISYMDDIVKTKGRLNRENVLEIIEKMPASDVTNYMFKGDSDLKFVDKTAAWGLNQIANSNGSIYGDLDNDGDLDLVVNNINKEAFVYENRSTTSGSINYLNIALVGDGKNTQGIGSKVKVYSEDKIIMLEQFPARGYLSSVSPILHVGLGKRKVDSVEIYWPSDKMEVIKNVNLNSTLMAKESNATFPAERKAIKNLTIFSPTKPPIEFTHKSIAQRDFDRQSLLLSELSFSGPVLKKADLNNDGLEDLFIGGSKDVSASIYLQSKSNRFNKNSNLDFDLDKGSEDTDAVFFDADSDGDLDIYVTSGGYHNFQVNDAKLQDRLYINNGEASFTKSENSLPEMLTSSSVVEKIDYDNDGLLDLFVGSCVVPGRFPEAPKSYFLRNSGGGKFVDATETVASEFINFGMVTDALAVDLDNSGTTELVVVGLFMPITIYSFVDSKLENVTTKYIDEPLYGLWNKIEFGDFNNDGFADLVLGNIGTNVQFQVTKERPGEIRWKDFDNNGSIDPIFSYHIDGISYPYMSRDELLTQLSLFRSKYTTYESFSKATTKEILSHLDTAGAKNIQLTEQRSGILLSRNEQKFDFVELPLEAQFSPIHTINVIDFNRDGYLDLLICGNNSRMKLSLGKLDANYGMVMKGLGNGKFNYVSQQESGLSINGDVRSVVQIGELLFFGINGRPLITKYANQLDDFK